MSQNSDNSSSLVCCVSLEWQNNDKGVLRRANLKTVTLRLLRNEFREIFLAVYEKSEESVCKKFLLKKFGVHKKFVNEGKATINFQELQMSVMISNAPPTQLVNFLKHLYIKMCGGKNDEKPGPRARLLSGKAHVLEEISPVTLQEVNGVRKPKQQAPDSTPPTGKKRTSSGILLNKSVKRSCLSSYIDPAPLTPEQKNVLNEALAGRNIFFTGSAGTGKSYLLRRIIGALPPDSTVATASTGVAACHIGGMTLHSFAGIGSGQASVERCIQLASKTTTYQMWRKCKHLIIDEVSMVQGSYFEKLDKVARALKNNDRPFGGIQLILCGDFLQLPPVTRDAGDDKRFCFQSSVWDESVHASFELTQVHRQSDPVFIDILQNIRIGRVTDEITEKLNATSKQNINKEGIQATRLCSHTKEAEIINSNKLKALSGTSKVFSAVDSDPTAASQLDQLTRVPNILELKVGTQVMLMKNLNVAEGLVNPRRVETRSMMAKHAAAGSAGNPTGPPPSPQRLSSSPPPPPQPALGPAPPAPAAGAAAPPAAPPPATPQAQPPLGARARAHAHSYTLLAKPAPNPNLMSKFPPLPPSRSRQPRGAPRRRSDPLDSRRTNGRVAGRARGFRGGPDRRSSLECLLYVRDNLLRDTPNAGPSEDSDSCSVASSSFSYSDVLAGPRRPSFPVDSDISSSGISTMDSSSAPTPTPTPKPASKSKPTPTPGEPATLPPAPKNTSATATAPDPIPTSTPTPATAPAPAPAAGPPPPQEPADLSSASASSAADDWTGDGGLPGMKSADFGPPDQIVVWYDGRNALDLGTLLQGSWPLRPAQLPDNNPQFYLDNQSQYHRLGPFGDTEPDHSVSPLPNPIGPPSSRKKTSEEESHQPIEKQNGDPGPIGPPRKRLASGIHSCPSLQLTQNQEFFLNNRSQYHRMGPFGDAAPDKWVTCPDCGFHEPVLPLTRWPF